MAEQPIDRPCVLSRQAPRVEPRLARSAAEGERLPVYDIREWRTPPPMRQTRPARALWSRGAGHRGIEPHPSPIVRTRPMPGDAAAMTAGPRLAVAASSLLRNLGGLVPRSARAPRAAADVEAIESALEHAGVRHVVCVGHLGCHATRATTRYASSAQCSGGPRARDVRAIEHHVFMQMHHVRAYLRRRAQHPVVRVSGIWVDETSGHMHAFDPARRAFAPLGDFDLARYSVTVPARPAPPPPQT